MKSEAGRDFETDSGLGMPSKSSFGRSSAAGSNSYRNHHWEPTFLSVALQAVTNSSHNAALFSRLARTGMGHAPHAHTEGFSQG